ncbi:MAG: guanine deaminase [Tepidimonas ignava]|uniref:Guanine deaminase n=1 Tax=Tepidimonas ignava TaxID=114249 RepID=A0A4R3LAC3_9BURK|nr:guanine deaminase [Tepidimonas ignava]TCS97071.1 guanine deaminase [Tepidimonas ignava]TSE22305.1 Guanine deaminase [Tepidimonas ignava]
MQAWRASLLWFDPHADGPQAHFEHDGLLVTAPDAAGVQRVLAVGAYAAVRAAHPTVPVRDHRGWLLAPGFIDLHVHYPQTDIIGAPAEGLLPWLQRYTFPQEARLADPDHAHAVARFFLDEMARHGVTTALTWATSHPASVEALLSQAQARGLRWITGKVLQDRHSPDGVRDDTETSLRDTETLLQRWHGRGRLGYAITPRFAPSCSDAQLRGAGELAARYPDVWIQSHVAEQVDEVRWVRELYPHDRSYLAVYERFGLLRPRAVYGHGIYLEDDDWALLRRSGAAIAVAPTSNLFLGSGFFDYAAARAAGIVLGLASDVGGGMSFSPLVTMRTAYTVGRAAVRGDGKAKQGVSLEPLDLWWQHTAGAARALGLAGTVGSLAPGSEADFVLLDPAATPLLARRCAQAQSLAEWLFALIMLGDDRAVRAVHVAGAAQQHNLT